MLKLPLLFYMIGYPGSGKTTFAATFCKRNKITHLHADRLGFELFRLPTFSRDEREIIMREMDHKAMSSLAAGKSVIYDAGINTAGQREKLRHLAEKYNTAAVGIWVKTPTKTSFERLSKPRIISDIRIVFDARSEQSQAAFHKSLSMFEEPQDEAFIVEISGLDDYERQRDDVLQYIFPPK